MRSNSGNLSEQEILELINQAKWFHSFEIAPGIKTPGKCEVDAGKILDSFIDNTESLEGKRVLEIGTWDGPYAFELESRGAKVTATDIQDPDSTGFNVSKKILGSEVEYVKTSVYDLSENISGQFDMVLFLGVFYHLKYPILAFEQIRSVLKKDGIMLFEGEGFTHYAETLNNRKIKEWLLLALLANSNIPLALCYPGRYKNSKNWHIPNVACLKGWLEATGFEIDRISTTAGNNQYDGHKLAYLKKLFKTFRSLRHNNKQRIFGVARKTKDSSIQEHFLVTKK